MDVSASLPSAPIRAGVARTFTVVLVAAALVLGGAGGYLVRGWSPAAAITTTHTTHPFVIEQAPYSSPRPSPAPQPPLTPDGFTIPI
jgi:hypothetical protein